jgi:hypothetical protein
VRWSSEKEGGTERCLLLEAQLGKRAHLEKRLYT